MRLELVEIAKLCGSPTDREQWLDRARRWGRLAADSEADKNVCSPAVEELLSELDADWTRAA